MIVFRITAGTEAGRSDQTPVRCAEMAVTPECKAVSGSLVDGLLISMRFMATEG
jgi:hypothetical protein